MSVKMKKSCEFQISCNFLCPSIEPVSESCSLKNATPYEEEDEESVLSQKVCLVASMIHKSS